MSGPRVEPVDGENFSNSDDDALALTVAYQDREVERLHSAIQKLIWASTGWCRFCNSLKPQHSPGCYVRKVVFKEVVWEELTRNA